MFAGAKSIFRSADITFIVPVLIGGGGGNGLVFEIKPVEVILLTYLDGSFKPVYAAGARCGYIIRLVGMT